MDKKIIDNIVWYIPFKKLRNSLREYLTELVNNNCGTFDFKNADLQYYINRGRFSQHYVRRMMAVEESIKYLEANNGRHIKMFNSSSRELEYLLLNEVKNDGLFLEFGVFTGTTINCMSNTLKDNFFYGFDSFEGLPEFWQTGYDKGRFSLEGNLPKVNKNVELIKGWFNETLPKFCEEHKEDIAFLHIDCDLYSSTKTIFDNLKDRIKSGTVITFDEYFGYYNWQDHEYKAFQELVKEKNIKYKYLSSNSYASCSVKILEIDQTRPDQTRPDQTRPDQTRP